MDKTAIETGAIKGGVALASLPLFTDRAYLYLAIIGAIVSAFGVIHELYGEPSRDKQHTKQEIIAEVIKGIVLGVVAIPMWYLVITEAGGSIALKLFGFEFGEVSNSLALLIAFALAWFTVPLFNFFINFFTRGRV